MFLFAARWPAMVDPETGLPRRWRQFLVGTRVLGVLDAREALTLAGATGTSNMTEPDRTRWFNRHIHAAGWESYG